MSNHYKKFGFKGPGIILSLFLIIILLFNIFGYFIYFNILQSNIRHEISDHIRNGLHDSELTIIEINSQNSLEIKWIKPSKEFSYHGYLYDVAKVVEKDGRKYYHCINDTKEDKLIREFAKNTDSSQKAKKLLNNFASSTYLINEATYKSLNTSTNHNFSIPHFNVILNIREISDPPPKLLV
jgi:hypothetical protein